MHGVTNTVTYIDDICVHTEGWTTHLLKLRHVFDRLRLFGLTVKPSKVELGLKEIEFLGHVISQGQLKTDNRIITKIMNLTIPTTKKQVRSLLGLVNYYSKFIPNLAEITSIFPMF